MADYSNPKASNAILGDLQEIVALIQSGAKMDPTGNTNIPNGAKRVVSVTGGYQIQSYNGSTWVSIGKLIHDCDTLDGKNTNTGTTANTIPVRDQNGALPGNVTGNAATATKLQTARTIDLGGILSATEQSFDGSKPITIPVNSVNVNNEQDNALVGEVSKLHGGTGRTDGAAADVVVSSAQGTVKASAYGQIGDAKNINNVDLDTLTVSGNYIATSGTVANNYPYAFSGQVAHLKVARSATSIQQTLYIGGEIWQRKSTNTGGSWTAWDVTGPKSSTLTLYISKSGSDSNTGTDSSYPVLTVNRAMEIAAGWHVISNGATVKLCFGEGDWGTVNFTNAPFLIHIFPYSGTVATQYSSSLPKFTQITIQMSSIVFFGAIVETMAVQHFSYAAIGNSYFRFAEIDSLYSSTVFFYSYENDKSVEVIAKDSHGYVLRAFSNACISFAGTRKISIAESLSLSRFLHITDNSVFVPGNVTFSLASGVSVTGSKYYVNTSSVGADKNWLDALPGSVAGECMQGAFLARGPWGGGDAHFFLAGDNQWRQDSSSVYARDVAIAGNASDLAMTDRGLLGSAKNPGGAIDANTIRKNSVYFINNKQSAASQNLPYNQAGYLVTYAVEATQWYARQTFYAYNSSRMFVRHGMASAWGSWQECLSTYFPGNYFTGATSTTDGARGIVPGPAKGQTGGYFLSGAGNFRQVPYLRYTVPKGGHVDAVEYMVPEKTNRIACIRVSNEPSSDLGFYTLCLGVNDRANDAPAGILILRDIETGQVSIETAGGLKVSGNLSVTGSISGQNAFSTGDFVWSYASSKTGFLLCNGAAISRTTYADLYAIIGTKFGTGDGSTTFNLPDMRGKVAQGANGNLGSVLAAGLPNVSAAVMVGAILSSVSAQALYETQDADVIRHTGTATRDSYTMRLDLSRGNSIYGKSTTVQPPAIALNCFIKY